LSVILAGTVLMTAGFGCRMSGAGDLELIAPVLSINEATMDPDSLALQISNGNGVGVQTRCDISPSRSRSGPGWHAINGVPDVSANATAKFVASSLKPGAEYLFRCQFYKTGLPTGQYSAYSDHLSGSIGSRR